MMTSQSQAQSAQISKRDTTSRLAPVSLLDQYRTINIPAVAGALCSKQQAAKKQSKSNW